MKTKGRGRRWFVAAAELLNCFCSFCCLAMVWAWPLPMGWEVGVCGECAVVGGESIPKLFVLSVGERSPNPTTSLLSNSIPPSFPSRFRDYYQSIQTTMMVAHICVASLNFIYYD